MGSLTCCRVPPAPLPRNARLSVRYPQTETEPVLYCPHVHRMTAVSIYYGAEGLWWEDDMLHECIAEPSEDWQHALRARVHRDTILAGVT